ncbi:MAG: hypothetical protein FJ206_01400 [Gemmatimonadetes bacterium]|nr:hypothetical protein [Gemmatimonadota bacterium]
MPKHPTVEIPNVGAMDHAWDVLGHWEVEFELPFHEDSIPGKLNVTSWKEAELDLEPWGAAAAGLPERVTLERASRVHLTDAGGGALQWVYVAAEDDWTLQATLWPGSLHLFIQPTAEPDEHLFRAVATRTREYYTRKYPLVGI